MMNYLVNVLSQRNCIPRTPSFVFLMIWCKATKKEGMKIVSISLNEGGVITLVVVLVAVNIGGPAVLLSLTLQQLVRILKISYLPWLLGMVVPQHLLGKLVWQLSILPVSPRGRTLLGMAMLMVVVI